MNKILLTLFGIMILTSISYTYALVEDLTSTEDEDMALEEILFAGSIAGYAIFGILMIKIKSTSPHIIAIIGSVVLIILYFIVISPMAESVLGSDTEEISTIGIICKILQFTVVILSGIYLTKNFLK